MSNPPPDPGRSPIRHHLVALPRGRPGVPAPARRHLVALPRGRPLVRFDEPADTRPADPASRRRDRRPLAAVVSSLCLLILLCCGGLAAVMGWLGGDGAPPAPARTSRRPAQAGVTPRTPAPEAPAATGTATPRPIRPVVLGARIGHRCAPPGSIGRAHDGLLVVCGPDRRGRDRWRPMTPTALRAIAPDLH